MPVVSLQFFRLREGDDSYGTVEYKFRTGSPARSYRYIVVDVLTGWPNGATLGLTAPFYLLSFSFFSCE